MTTDGPGAYATYGPRAHRLRRNLADLMGATAPEIAITHNTAEAANIIANGIDWRPDDKILTLDREYPSTIYPWMNVEKRFGARLVLLEEKDGRLDEDAIADAIWRERPRLFAISAVEWCSGYRFDLQKIGRACREAVFNGVQDVENVVAGLLLRDRTPQRFLHVFKRPGFLR